MYKKISINEELISQSTDSWDDFKKILNQKTNFILPDKDEKSFFNQVYKQSNIKMSIRNFLVHSNYIIHVKTNEKFRPGNFEILLKNKSSKRPKVKIKEDLHPISHFKGSFNCPSCDNEYLVEINPVRGLGKDSSLCRDCQIKTLHKFKDVELKQKKTMLKKYGVEYPLQSPEIQEKFKNSMVEKYGAEFAMQSETLKAKYFKKYGSKKISSSAKEKELVEFIECIFDKNLVKSYKTGQKYFKFNNIFGFVDIFVEDINLAIEFYGDVFHGNPSIFKEDDMCFNGIFYSDIWKSDAKRIKMLKSALDCDVYIVWEKSWKEDKFKIINEIKEKYASSK